MVEGGKMTGGDAEVGGGRSQRGEVAGVQRGEGFRRVSSERRMHESRYARAAEQVADGSVVVSIMVTSAATAITIAF